MRPSAIVLVFSAIVSTILTLPVYATDWPMFHLKRTHTGFNPLETVIDRNNVQFLTRSWVGIAGDIARRITTGQAGEIQPVITERTEVTSASLIRGRRRERAVYSILGRLCG